MNLALRALTILLVVFAAGLAQAQQTGFTHPGVQADAKRYETYLKGNWQPGNRAVRDLRAEGARLLSAGTDPRAAARSYAQAVVADANDADSWQGLARALLAIKPDQGSERYDLPVNASGAAWNAYERATTLEAKAASLWVLHEALKRRSYWRPAIDALKASLALAANTEVLAAYEKLVAEHGFRVVDYKIEADSAQPRLCINFSERLAPGQIDWAEYFKVDGKDPQAVTAEARQICIDGFAHGKRYEVQVRAGLPSAVGGEKLAKTAELAVYVRDRSPSVRATGRGYVLPNRGQQGIPLVSVNTEKVGVEVYRIGDRNLAQTLQGGDFQKQISTYELENLKERTGARVYQGELAVASRLNEDVTTAFPIAEAVPKLQPGVYVLAAYAEAKKADEGHRRPATQWFIVSDIGLTAIEGDDGVHAFVRSLATTTPVVNANLRLVARNNEVLGNARTDSRGYARFDAGLMRGEGGLAPAVLVADGPDGDYAFLDLAAAAFDLTDRGVKGRNPPGPIDAFAYTDRGVYRPGEQVHLTTLARDNAGKASGVPVTVIFSRPDGVEHSRVTLPDQGQGGRATTLALAGGAMTGTWRAKVHTDPKANPIAQIAFLVEDFVPERLELKLDPAVKALSPQEPGTIKLTGRYLYGPPAADLAVEGEIVVKPSTKDVPGFAGYRFGLADEQVSPVRKPLEGLPATNAQGNADILVQLPALPKTSRQLEADVILKLRESGGRTIERTISLPVDMRAPRIGIKPLFSGNQVQEGEPARFEAIVLGADGKAVAAKDLKWQLMQLDQRWQWYSRDGSWNFEPVTHTRRIATGTADASPDAPAKIETKVDWGRYRLEVSASDGSGLVSSLVFNGGYWADESADSPEVLDVALDKPSYRAGETARVKITSRTGGRALIAVLNAGLAATQEVELPAGGREVPLRVSEDWNPGAYVTVMLYRPLDEKAKRMPGRALGLRWLAIDQAPRTLKVGMELPEKVKSGSTLTVPVKVSGLAAGEEARITVAAVDVGILNLTRFEAPKPEGWFFGQRKLASEIRDLYGRLIDGMRAERGKLRSGGDGGSNGMSMQGTPPVEETLALFSGIVKVGSDGTANVNFQLPDFNGTVRVSAVAWSGTKLGSASKDLIVRDPVALTASAPRFLTLGDTARLELAIHNVEGPAARYTGERPVRVRARQPAAGGLRARRCHRRGRAQARDAPAEADRGGADDAGHPRHRTQWHRRPAPPEVRRQGAGGRHPTPHGELAGGQGRQDDAHQRPVPGPDRAALQGHHHGRASGHVRRAGHPRRARPLPLWLRRADDEPGAASALRQQRGQAHGACHRHAAARAHRGRDCPRARDAGRLGRLRRLGTIGRRHVADELCHRLSHEGEGSGLRRAPAALHPGARSAAELHQLRPGLRERRRGQGLCALRARPQRPRPHRRAALLRRHPARPVLDAAGAGSACSRTRHARRQAPRREGPAGGAQDHRRQGRRRDAARLRHGRARRRGADHAGLRDRHRPGRGAAPRRRGGQGLQGQDLHLDAGAGLDAAGRPRAGGRDRQCHAQHQWRGAQGPADPRR